MPESRDPEKVQDALRELNQGETGQELVFDPRTGQLIVTNQPSPDSVIATDTASSGYFR